MLGIEDKTSKAIKTVNPSLLRYEVNLISFALSNMQGS
jgi:hypothetical protein